MRIAPSSTETSPSPPNAVDFQPARVFPSKRGCQLSVASATAAGWSLPAAEGSSAWQSVGQMLSVVIATAVAAVNAAADSRFVGSHAKSLRQRPDSTAILTAAARRLCCPQTFARISFPSYPIPLATVSPPLQFNVTSVAEERCGCPVRGLGVRDRSPTRLAA